MKTLIIGGSGKIGVNLIKNNNSFLYTYYSNKIKGGIKFDIAKDKISKIIKKYDIKSVIFLGAISDPNTCFKYKKFSKKINVTNTKKILEYLIKKKIYFIFFSSEFIFDGKKGNYKESDYSNPINEYGKQKLEIEKFIENKAEHYAIFRIAKTYGNNLEDNTLVSNYLKSLLQGKRKFNVAYDQFFSPLYVEDLKKILSHFLKYEIKGIYNVGGPDRLSRYQILKKTEQYLKKNVKKNIKIKKTKLETFKYLDKRPLDVSMNTKKIQKKLNFRMSKLSVIVKKTIKNLKINEKILKKRYQS